MLEMKSKLSQKQNSWDGPEAEQTEGRTVRLRAAPSEAPTQTGTLRRARRTEHGLLIYGNVSNEHPYTWREKIRWKNVWRDNGQKCSKTDENITHRTRKLNTKKDKKQENLTQSTAENPRSYREGRKKRNNWRQTSHQQRRQNKDISRQTKLNGLFLEELLCHKLYSKLFK